MELSSLPGFPRAWATELSHSGIVTAGDLLSMSEGSLATSTRTSLACARSTASWLACTVAPLPCSSLALLKRDKETRSTLPTEAETLDAALKGGLPPSLTELVGCAGVGKTQTALTLAAVATTRDGGGGGVVWVDTEGAFSAQRLRELLCARYPAVYGTDAAGRSRVEDALQHVVLFQPSSLAEAVALLAHMEGLILEKGVRLVVVDSVAALARREFDTALRGDMQARTELLNRMSAHLKLIADTFRVPVLVTNQVRSMPRGQRGDAAVDEELTPALGVSWAHSVNTRLYLSKGVAGERQMTIMKSSVAPPLVLRYIITDAGMQELRPGA